MKKLPEIILTLILVGMVVVMLIENNFTDKPNKDYCDNAPECYAVDENGNTL